MLLLHPGGLVEFEGVDCHNPNCVIVGGAEEQFTYEHMNEAFRLLLNSSSPVLLAMGYGWVILSWSMIPVWPEKVVMAVSLIALWFTIEKRKSL